MNRTDAGGTIKSDQTLLSILDELQYQDGVGVTELGHRLDLSKGTVHKHLKTLERAAYIEKVDGKYQLGMRFLSLGGLARNRNRLCFAAKEWVEQLADETGEMTTFAIGNGDMGMWIYFYNDLYNMREELYVGERFELNQIAPGKAILSKYSNQRIDQILSRRDLDAKTQNTVTDPQALIEEIEEVRRNGIAFSREEYREGALAIAAPIEDKATETVGAIGLAGPSSEVTRQKLMNEYGESLRDMASRLELKLHYI